MALLFSMAHMAGPQGVKNACPGAAASRERQAQGFRRRVGHGTKVETVRCCWKCHPGTAGSGSPQGLAGHAEDAGAGNAVISCVC